MASDRRVEPQAARPSNHVPCSARWQGEVVADPQALIHRLS